MSYSDDQVGVTEPPHHDTLYIKFRGDNHTISLPYVEVANGDIVGITDKEVEIMLTKEQQQELVKMSYADFTKLIETTFDTKEIVELQVQLAGTYDQIKLL
jgi:hypothetical protein